MAGRDAEHLTWSRSAALRPRSSSGGQSRSRVAKGSGCPGKSPHKREAERRGYRASQAAEPRAGARLLRGKAQRVTLDDGERVLGNIEFVDGAVLLSATQTVEQMMASSTDRPSKPANEIPADIRASTVQEVLDRHCQAVLNQPIDMLGGKTPRACARTRLGREKVAGWLKLQGSQSSRKRDPEDPIRSYKFGWMWTELGIDDLRR